MNLSDTSDISRCSDTQYTQAAGEASHSAGRVWLSIRLLREDYSGRIGLLFLSDHPSPLLLLLTLLLAL